MSYKYYFMPKQRNKSKGSKIWYGGISEGEKIRWVSLHTTDKKVAMDWYNAMQASRYAPHAPPEEKAITLDGAVDTFLNDIEKVRRRANGTVKAYQGYLRGFQLFLAEKGIFNVQKITAEHCSEFAAGAFKEAAAFTARSKIVLFRHFFDWVIDNFDLSIKNPFKKIKVQKAKSEPRKFWTVEECERIIAHAATPEYCVWFALMAFAGLRFIEAKMLKKSNILPCSDGGNEIEVVGKGSKHAILPINRKLRAHINAFLIFSRKDSGEYLLPDIAKTSNKMLYAAFKLAVKNAGLEDDGCIIPHRFRHSFASNLLRAGKNLVLVSKLMRHEDINVTHKHYIHILPNDMREAVEL